MANFSPFNCDSRSCCDLKEWLPNDDVTHFVVAAVGWVPIGAFQVAECSGGKPQYPPRLMLALLIYSYANGIFSSRRIERATHRDISVRSVAASQFHWHAIARLKALPLLPVFQISKTACPLSA